MKKYSGLLGTLGFGLAVLSLAASAQVIPNLGGPSESSDDEGGSDSDVGGDRRYYVAPMFTYIASDRDRNTKDGMGGTISLGKQMTSGLNLELTGFYAQMDPSTSTGSGAGDSVELNGYGAALMIFPSQTFQYLYGVLALHQGSVENHPTTPATTGFAYRTTVFDPGIGYLVPMSQWLGGFEMALRLEARYRVDAHTRSQAGNGRTKHFYEPVANIGLMFPLGKLPVTAAPVEEVAVVPAGDADSDGVPDDRDQCPDTPAGTTVNEQGCENDADGDAVVDRLDTCPETPAGTAVNEQGCPAVKDADGDGVPDETDTCPETPAGTAVDEAGCPPKVESGCRAPVPGEPINLEGCATGESVVLKGVNFEVNSARLTANAKVILNQVADSLASSSMKIEIGGHTDAQGSDDFNQKLSDRRAQSVQGYLIARGIDSSRLTAKGYGETQPVDTNETPEGRELNRRVELKVVDGGQQPQ
ncbi:MAG TPA: OmpA family protein [Verrucomicrobiae bacterium]|nr:OmpA family protein [Verrucomicrobiae bacterium]